jgi:hypothetical protein
MTPALPSAATPAHLTEALRRAGVLGDDRVADVEVLTSYPTILSSIVRLRLTYEGTAGTAPHSLIVKTAHPDRPPDRWQGGRQEVAFYRDIASQSPADVMPRCFEAWLDDASGAWHLLLEDLTDSHFVTTQWPLPPTLTQCESIVVALAHFHAAWWNDPRVGVTAGTWPEPQALEQRLQDLAAAVARFADALGDRLSAGRRAFYTQFLEAAPRLIERRLSPRDKTIVHGDAHVWNCFLPKSGSIDGARLFDWDCWRPGTASDDLAYMMALHWHPELRSVREGRLLDRYHDELLTVGVKNYDRCALQDDYRLSVLWAAVLPIVQHSANIPPVIWWHHLDRIHLAIDDLGCRDLLAG